MGMLTEFRSLQREEAIRRLRSLSLYDCVKRDFEEEGRIGLSENVCSSISDYNGKLTIETKCDVKWLSPEQEELVKNFEEKRGALVYHVILVSKETGGNILNMLYVSNDQSQWELDREDLNEGNILAFVCNDETGELNLESIDFREQSGRLFLNPASC